MVEDDCLRDFRVLGVIPARGGSKSIPNKNVVDLDGKPLIAYTIQAAHKAQLLDGCIVSTDCEEIASVAKACGVDVPFIRPSGLATDSADSLGVVLVHGTPVHSIIWRGVIERLRSQYRIHYLDLPGYGESARFDGQEVRLRAFARVLRAFIQHLGLERPHLVGHDFGAAAVMSFIFSRLAQPMPH